MSHDPWIWVASLLTLCMFSFLYKDNPVYKAAEHLFTGLTVGYTIAIYWHNAIIPYIVQGTFRDQNWLYLIPLSLGLLYLFRFVPRLNYLMLIPIAIGLGLGNGLSLPRSLETNVVKQMQGTILYPSMLDNIFDPYKGLIVSLIIMIGVIGTISYFFFSREHKGVLKFSAHIGIWFVMIGFGASFGYTVMARVSLLIGRLQFLMTDWLQIIR